MEIRVIRGFADIELAPAPRVPRTLDEVRAIRQKLADIGLGNVTESGFQFSLIPEVPYFAAWEVLRSAGWDYADGEQALGVPADVIRSFVESNQQRAHAWANNV